MTLSLLGMYRYNEGLFDNIHLPPEIDKKVLINNLLAECAELEILYTDPDFLAFMIGEWSAKEVVVWEKLYNTTMFKYDPISNYDRKESWTDIVESKGNSTEKVAGFNNPKLVESSGADGKSESTSKHEAHIYGNIGVTTSQQMLEEERRVVQFNVISYIIDSFKSRFCILIY